MSTPLWLTPVSEAEMARGDGPTFNEFTQFLRITKDSIGGDAGTPLVMRPWQALLMDRLYARRADGLLKHRLALIGEPRKNGKSALAAGIALHGLAFGPTGGEVYSCAGDKLQARIVFDTTKKMVDMEPQFAGMFRTYRDVIEFPATGGVYRVLSAEAFSKEGLNPHLVIFDEVHVQPNRELWDVMALAFGARKEPLMVGITTAGVRSDSTGNDSICYELYQYGMKIARGEISDPTFFMSWWGAPEGADHRDPAVWAAANPGFGDIVGSEDFHSAILRTPEAEFRTKRLNQWVSAAQTWLPGGTWDACEAPGPVPDGAEVVLGFDGSYNNDSTALVVVSCPTGDDDKPHVDVVELWEKPTDAGNDWKVPILAVEDTIRAACQRWHVREIACDPARWARSMEILEDDGLPVVEFPQSPARMVPATQRFYEAVMNKTLTHSGDPRLARHISNATVKVAPRGSQIYKDAKGSPRKIDAAVCAVMGLERAMQEPELPPTPQFFNWNEL